MTRNSLMDNWSWRINWILVEVDVNITRTVTEILYHSSNQNVADDISMRAMSQGMYCFKIQDMNTTGYYKAHQVCQADRDRKKVL
jgi:hypothetical protein